MKRIIFLVMFCLIIVFGMIQVSCDNGVLPDDIGDIEKSFITDYGLVIEDFFDSEVEGIIKNSGE